MLVAQPDARVVGGLQRHRRIDAVSLQIEIVPEAARVLVHAVDAHRRPGTDRLVDVRSCTLGVERAEGHGAFAKAVPVCLLSNAVDDAAAAAASEDHGVRPFENLDAVDVVEVAEVLDVIAHAIGEEVGRGVLAANGDLVAVSFTLARRHARDVAQHVGHAPHRLVFDLLLGDDRYRLRNVDERRVGLGRSRGARRYVADDTFGVGRTKWPRAGLLGGTAGRWRLRHRSGCDGRALLSCGLLFFRGCFLGRRLDHHGRQLLRTGGFLGEDRSHANG